MAHRRSDYVPLGYSAAIPFYPAENNPHEKLRLFCGHHHQHYPDDPSNRNRAAYSRQSSVENGNKCTSLDRISYLSEDRIQDDSLIKYSRQLTADSCHRNRIHRPSRHERSPSVDQNSGDSHLYPIEREHPYPDPTPFPSGESVRERNHANQNGFARVAIWPCDRSSIGSNSCGGRGLQRQSSGSSFADSLPSSDLPLPTFSPSISLSGSDSAFINALYDEGWRHNKQMLNTQFEDPSKNWARQTEESYNLQLAFALRLTAEASLTEGLDLLGSDCKETDVESGSFLRSSAEGIAHRFWVNGSLSYHDKVQDGFYYIWGMNPYVWTMCNDLDEGGRMPSLESLRAVDASYSSMEVVLVDKRGDSHLRELENKALSLAYGCTSAKEVVEHLGKLVCMLMGGAASTEHGDLTTRWKVSCKMLRDCLNSIVLPIGSLSVGLCRHRSLLFKVLADTIDLPCRIARGCKYCGLDGGSSSLVQLGDEREYFVDLIGKPGSLCHPDSFVNGPLSLSIASPLHFPDFKSSQVTDEVRYLAQWYASDSRYLERMFDKTDSKLNVAAAGQIDDSSKESRIAHSDSAVVSSAVSSAHATTKPFFRSSVASPRVDDVSMQKVAVQHLMEKQVLKTLNEDKVANNCGIVSDIDLTTDPTITLGGERAQLQKGHFRKDSENNNCEIMCVSTKGNANGEECLRQSPFQTHEHRNVQVESNERESLQHRLLQIHKQRDVQNHASDEECPQQRLMQTQKHKDAQTKLDRSKDGRVEDGSALMTKAHVEISLAIDGLEIPWEDLVLKERIGAGSFGTVHHADWHGSDVAVKILIDQDLNEERLKEFLREVAIMKRLRHPNVVLFMGAVTMRPNLSIVTEYLPRGSLYRLIHRAGARELLDERRRLRMALDVAKGMNYLHWLSPPIVHRDLKSPNLLVDKTWTVKVCDFGLSQLKANTFLSSKSAAGTPEWMAPEVLRDEPSNEKSDIYSFGVILWELVTMQQPWNGLSPAQVVGAVGFQNRRLQIPKDMNPDIATIIESCWASDSKQRPTFASIMESLKPLVKSPGIQSIQSGMLQHA